VVCRELHKLPNDPALRDLTPIQALWVVGNVVHDAEQLDRGSPSMGGAVKENTIMATELDDAEFAAFSARSRAEAATQAIERQAGVTHAS